MPLDPASLYALAAACAPQVAPDTLLAVVRVESGGNSLAIGVNGAAHASVSPSTRVEAIRTASALLAEGRNLDLGLGQINARNLAALGLGVADAFDPCRNLAASATVLQTAWRRVRPRAQSPLAALKTTFSIYNTGDPVRGLRNGYAGKVTATGAPTPLDPPAAPGERIAARPDWLVFGSGRRPTFVVEPQDGAQ